HQLRVGSSTVASIVSDGVTAIWDCLVEEFMAVPTTEDWRAPPSWRSQAPWLTEYCQRLRREDLCLMVFVADEAFPLRTNLMRPFPGRILPESGAC
ncbi:unnamed protein product, partial [Gadus morhua 'NCC']